MKRCLKCQSPIQTAMWCCTECEWEPALVNGSLVFAPELLQETAHFFNKDAFQNLYQREDHNFWFRARNRLITWALSTYFPNANNYLEVGCGTGYVSAAIQRCKPHLSMSAADVFQESLPFVKSRVGENASVFQMDGRCIPFTEEFDLIGAFDVLEHIEEDESVLQQIHQALKPGGGVLLTVPQHPQLWSEVDTEAFHVRRYTQDELQEKLVKQGFNIVFTTSFVTFLLPLMFVSRRRQTKKSASTSEYHASKWLNKVLEYVLIFEQTLIKLGLRFPIGGSRLVVARKA